MSRITLSLGQVGGGWKFEHPSSKQKKKVLTTAAASFSLGKDNEWMLLMTGRPNLFRETKSAGENGNKKEKIFSRCLAQSTDWCWMDDQKGLDAFRFFCTQEGNGGLLPRNYRP